MTTDTARGLTADRCSLTIRVTADPGLQALQRVIDVLAVNDIVPCSIISDHQLDMTKLALQFCNPPPRFQQLCTRIGAIVGVRKIDW